MNSRGSLDFFRVAGTRYEIISQINKFRLVLLSDFEEYAQYRARNQKLYNHKL